MYSNLYIQVRQINNLASMINFNTKQQQIKKINIQEQLGRKKGIKSVTQLTRHEDLEQFVGGVLQSQRCGQIHLTRNALKHLQLSSHPESQKLNTQP